MQERVVRVQGRLEAVDGEVERFVAASGLTCPPGCGACCLSPDVEATVVELAPMAAALVAAGRAEATLAALAAAPRPAPCVLYTPDPANPRQGRCSAYATRPLICRLFGFGARHGRSGRPELAACKTMRAADPARMESVTSDELLVRRAPVMADHAHGLASDFPGEGSVLLPINVALELALQRELLHRRMTELEGPPDDGAPPCAAA